MRCNRTHPRASSSADFHRLHPNVLVTLVYDGDVRESILQLKYAHRLTNARWMGCHLAMLVQDVRSSIGCVTWIPTTPSRRRTRGYDQAQLIAESLARLIRVPAIATLRRIDRIPQTGKGRQERLLAPQFEARRPCVNGQVLVVDDVVTTGATLFSARQSLASQGVDVADIITMAVAATPSR